MENPKSPDEKYSPGRMKILISVEIGTVRQSRKRKEITFLSKSQTSKGIGSELILADFRTVFLHKPFSEYKIPSTFLTKARPLRGKVLG